MFIKYKNKGRPFKMLSKWVDINRNNIESDNQYFCDSLKISMPYIENCYPSNNEIDDKMWIDWYIKFKKDKTISNNIIPVDFKWVIPIIKDNISYLKLYLRDFNKDYLKDRCFAIFDKEKVSNDININYSDWIIDWNGKSNIYFIDSNWFNFISNNLKSILESMDNELELFVINNSIVKNGNSNKNILHIWEHKIRRVVWDRIINPLDKYDWYSICKINNQEITMEILKEWDFNFRKRRALQENIYISIPVSIFE